MVGTLLEDEEEERARIAYKAYIQSYALIKAAINRYSSVTEFQTVKFST